MSKAKITLSDGREIEFGYVHLVEEGNEDGKDYLRIEGNRIIENEKIFAELINSVQKAMQEADAMEEMKYQNTIYFKDGNSECLVFIGDTNVAEAMAEEEDWQYGTLALWGIDSKEGVRTIPKENILFIESKELEN